MEERSTEGGATLPFCRQAKSIQLLPIVSPHSEGFVMWMIFDPSTPTLCKWVCKREAWYNYFPTHTLMFASLHTMKWLMSMRHFCKVDLNFCCVFNITTGQTLCFSPTYVCLLLSNQCPEASERHRERERNLGRWTCCHVTELRPYVVMAVVGKVTRSHPP